MNRLIVPGARITGVACAVPRRVVTNNDERVVKMVGVRERRHIDGKPSLLSLAEAAARQLMTARGWFADDVDAVVFVTQTAPRRMPSISCELQDRLGLSKNIPCF